MAVHVFSPFDERSCRAKIERAFPTAEVVPDGQAIVVQLGRNKIRCTIEGWGGPPENQNRFGGVRSEVQIESIPADSDDRFAEGTMGKTCLGQMVRCAIDTLQPIDKWNDGRGVY